MKFRSLIIFCLGCFIPLVSEARAENPLQQVNIEKLLNPETRLAEVTKLKNTKSRRYSIESARVIPYPQKKGKAFYLLLVRSSPVFSKYSSYNDEYYYMKDTQDLFKEHIIVPEIDSEKNLANSNRLYRESISFFDSDGKELRDFGWCNYVKDGYLFDFNKDGILDDIDHVNWGVKSGMEVKSLAIRSVEATPKTLLHVVYEWHPHSSHESNDWSYEMKDVNNDGFADVLFGPKSDITAVTYLWDNQKKDFTGPEGKKGDHFRRINEENSAQFLKEGGLDYEILDPKGEKATAPVARKEVMARKVHPLPDFKSMSMDEAIAFFKPGKTQGKDGSSYIPTDFPDNLRDLSPKDAALRYAKANMNNELKQTHVLVINDREGVVPPKKGWIVFNQRSSGCYFLMKWCWAINLDKRYLLYFCGEASSGIRLIKLTSDEARYLGGTLWWLNRIRSMQVRGDYNPSTGSISTADGRCSLYHSSGEQITSYFQNKSKWSDNGAIQKNWVNNYSRTICGNLISEYCETYIPKYLADRWHKPILGNIPSARATITDIFELHKEIQEPAELLAWTADFISAEGMTEFTGELLLLKKQTRNPTALEIEITDLKKELKGMKRGDYWSPDQGSDEEKLAKKFWLLSQLKAQLRLNFHKVFADRIESPLERLETVKDVDKIIKLATGKSKQASWAKDILRKLHPKQYSALLLKAVQNSKDSLEKINALDEFIKNFPDDFATLDENLSEEEKG